MATMTLKDYVICACGKEMFPSAFNKKLQKITYQCIVCKETIEKTFDEVQLGEGEKHGYFVLNDDGIATWKCFSHGYCEYDVESLMQMDMSKFVSIGCLLCKDEDEIMEDMEEAEESGREQIAELLSVLSEEQIIELLDEFGIEEDEDEFDGNYVELLFQEYLMGLGFSHDDFDEFYYELRDKIYDLFEIEYGF